MKTGHDGMMIDDTDDHTNSIIGTHLDGSTDSFHQTKHHHLQVQTPWRNTPDWGPSVVTPEPPPRPTRDTAETTSTPFPSLDNLDNEENSDECSTDSTDSILEAAGSLPNASLSGINFSKVFDETDAEILAPDLPARPTTTVEEGTSLPFQHLAEIDYDTESIVAEVMKMANDEYDCDSFTFDDDQTLPDEETEDALQTTHNDQNSIHTNSHQKSKAEERSKNTKKPPAKAGKTKTKKDTVHQKAIKDLILLHGTHNVFLRTGGPSCTNTGGMYYRAVIDKNYKHFKAASTKDDKMRICQQVYKEIIDTGCRFFTVEGDENVMNDVTNTLRAIQVEILPRIKKALQGTSRRIQKYWQWKPTTSTSKPQNWTSFDTENAMMLEDMFQKYPQERQHVQVTIAGEKYVVDVNAWKMHKDKHPDNVFDVRRRRLAVDVLQEMIRLEARDHDNTKDDSTAGGQSSSSDSSDSTSPRNSNAPSSQGSPGVHSLSAHNNAAMIATEYPATFMAKNGINFTIREATPEEIYDAISLTFDELLKEERNEDILVAKSVPTLAESTVNASLDQPHLSPSTTIPTSNERGGSVEKSRTDLADMAKVQPGVVRIDPSSKTKDDVVWVWRENRSRMARHDVTVVHGDAKDCWIRYDASTTRELEQAYRSDRSSGTSILSGKYDVDFATMRQSNILSGYQREVKRIGFQELVLPIMTKTLNSKKLRPDLITKGNASDLDTLTKKMMSVQLHDDSDKTSASLTPSTTHDLNADDLGSAK